MKDFVEVWKKDNSVSHMHDVLNKMIAENDFDMLAAVGRHRKLRDSFEHGSNDCMYHWSVMSYLADIDAQFKRLEKSC